MSEDDHGQHLPSPIEEFLAAKGGRSLIVKGQSGTGKTTLSLVAMETSGRLAHSTYISTRVSDEALYRHFPWLREKEWRERVLDCSRSLLRTMVPQPEPEPTPPEGERGDLVRLSRRFLSSVYASSDDAAPQLDRTELRGLQASYDVRDLVTLYDRIEGMLPHHPLVVIDSLEGLGERLDLSLLRLVRALQKDLVEHSGVTLVLVLETETSHDLDYLVDGVVLLHRLQSDGHRLREIEILKVRGVQITHPSYLYTLTGGRFRYFESYQIPMAPVGTEGSVSGGPVALLPDVPGYFSTGNAELDSVLGGGLPRGSNVLVEMVDNLPHQVYEGLIHGMVVSFVGHGRGVMVVPFDSNAPEDFAAMVEGSVSDASARSLLRVAQKERLDKPYPQSYVFTLSFDDLAKDYERWLRERAKLREATRQGILETIALETQEARFGEEAYKGALSLSSEQARAEGDVIVRVSKPGIAALTQRVANTSNVHLKLRVMHGAVVLYGERPRTSVYVVEPTTAGSPWAYRLVPIL